MPGEQAPSRRLRQPRLAELVAGGLRQRIVDGEIEDGSLLPPLEALCREFGVSPPSIREALRILENERLITVRRGNVGGAVVHRPKAAAVGYMLGLVLQSKRVRTADLSTALTQLEPLCAGLCASRADRKKTVLPRLRASCEGLAETIESGPVELEHWSRQFHHDLIRCCGNESLVLVVGALEQLWAAQSEAWAYRVAYADESPDVALRQEGLQAHWDITRAVESGDPVLAERLVRDHMGHPKIYSAANGRKTIRATEMSLLGLPT